MKSIQQFRKEAELTQQELADQMGVDRSYISKIENGVVPLTDAVLQMKLSKALGIPLSDISPSDIPCRKHFPSVVHGKLVYDAGQYYEAIKENAPTCKSCKEELERIRKDVLNDDNFKRTILRAIFKKEKVIEKWLKSLTPEEIQEQLKDVEKGYPNYETKWAPKLFDFAENYLKKR